MRLDTGSFISRYLWSSNNAKFCSVPNTKYRKVPAHIWVILCDTRGSYWDSNVMVQTGALNKRPAQHAAASVP